MKSQGHILIDPKQITKITKKKPYGMFNKLLHVLTGGAGSEKIETETFTAVSILQQIHEAFTSLGIDNLVHLAKDGNDFYLDTKGNESDLETTLDSFAGSKDSAGFEKLVLVVEHETGILKTYIEVDINRTNKAGNYPIEITVDAFMKQFKANPGEDVEEMRARISQIGNADEYRALVAEYRSAFTDYVSQLVKALTASIGVDDIKAEIEHFVVKPSQRVTSARSFRMQASRGRRSVIMPLRDYNRGPVLNHHYHGVDDFYLYAYLWAELCHENEWPLADVEIVDTCGASVVEIEGEVLVSEMDEFSFGDEVEVDMAEATETTDTEFGEDVEVDVSASDEEAETGFGSDVEVDTSAADETTDTEFEDDVEIETEPEPEPVSWFSGTSSDVSSSPDPEPYTPPEPVIRETFTPYPTPASTPSYSEPSYTPEPASSGGWSGGGGGGSSYDSGGGGGGGSDD